MNLTKTYFVTKQHDMAKAMVELLTDRLDDTGWELMLRHTSFLYLYRNKSLTYGLCSCVLEQGLCCTTYWTVNGIDVPASEYFQLENRLTKDGAVLESAISVREQKYRLAGTSDSVLIRSTGSGVYLTASANSEVHDMLSEYYTLAEDPTTLYSAVDDNGDLWELTELGTEDED